MVFPSRTGTPLDPNHIRRALRTATEKGLVFKISISMTCGTRSRRVWFNPVWILQGATNLGA